MAYKGLILIVGGISGDSHSCGMPIGVAHSPVLTQVGEGYDISGVLVVAALVGYPYLHTVYLYAGGKIGQSRHRSIIVVTEIAREEEMAVLLVVGSINIEG